MNKVTGAGYYDTMPRTAAFVSSFIIAVVVLGTTFHSGIPFEKNIQLICLIVVATWCFLSVKSIRLAEHRNDGSYRNIITVFFMVVLGIYLAYTIWHSTYLTNKPVAAINGSTGGIHNDCLFHSSIAQGIRYYGRPSFLVNTDSFYNYHFGSHVVMAILAFVTDIPVYFVYCYIYPILFLPLYIYLLLSVSTELKYFLSGNGRLTAIDLGSVVCFVLPVLMPKDWLNRLADYRGSWLISESYLVANVFALLFFKILFLMVRKKWFDNRTTLFVYTVVAVPLFIVLTSLSKISVGFFLYTGIVYYLVRKFTSDKRAWFLSVYYTIWFAIIYFLPGMFYSPFKSNTNFSRIALFDFLKTYVTDPRLWGVHILVYFLMAVFFLICRLKGEKSFLKIIKSKKYVLEEILFLVCVVGFIPGNLFVIRGGSAFYFASVQQLMAIILIIGYNIPNLIWERYLRPRSAVSSLCAVFFSFCLGWNTLYSTYIDIQILVSDCGLNSYQYEESQRDGTYWKQISYINQLSQNNKKDYYLYVNEDAAIWKFYENRDSAMHFYPAMTGIVAIGILYYDDGQMYYNSGEPYTSGWYKPNPEEIRMTYDDALEKAKRDGKKGLFYVHKDTVDYISFD